MSMKKKIQSYFFTDEDEFDEEVEEGTNMDVNSVGSQIKRQKKTVGISSIVTKKPSNYDEIYKTADYLKRNYPVILDLNRNSDETINNIMDFLGGVVYAIDGLIVNVAPNTYMFLPNGVEIESDEDNSIPYLFGDKTAHQKEAQQAQGFNNNNVAQPARPTGGADKTKEFNFNKGVVKLQ